ncbi:MAG: lipocalin family protein [Akkermansiaceae bacterium]
MKQLAAILTLLFFLASCSSKQGANNSLPTVKNFSAEKYAGKWHEIARLPNFFERGVVAATATYGVLPDGKISVYNQGLKESGKRTSIMGAATPVGKTPNGEAKLEVRFTKFPASLFAGDYWVLDLNDAHTRAIVGSPNLKFLWLLSKDAKSTPADFSKGVKRMEFHGFEMSELISNPKRLD